jgi:hypothetical protein
MVSAEAVDDRRNESALQRLADGYPDVANRGIVQKVDFIHALAQVVEHRRTPFDERAAVESELDAA